MTEAALTLFNRQRVRRNRLRIGRDHDPFLAREAAASVADRLAIINRSFDQTLYVGVDAALPEGVTPHVRMDWCDSDVIGDVETLPFAGQCFDLVVAIGGLHWVNDLPGALIQLRQALRPGGLLLASFLGGDTLWQLRRVLLQAEADLTSGASARVAPFVDVREGGALLQRAGFSGPVADSERITVDYGDMFALLRDLRQQGEGNGLAEVKPLRRDVLIRAADLYQQEFAGPSGRIEATFSFLALTGWRAPLALQ